MCVCARAHTCAVLGEGPSCSETPVSKRNITKMCLEGIKDDKGSESIEIGGADG